MWCILQVNASAAWGFIASIFIFIMPLVSEGLEIRTALKEKRSVDSIDAEQHSSIPSPSKVELEKRPGCSAALSVELKTGNGSAVRGEPGKEDSVNEENETTGHEEEQCSDSHTDPVF